MLNKCLEGELKDWNPAAGNLSVIKESLESHERELKKELKAVFPVVLEFPEVISLSPTDHIQHLTEKWKSYVVQS